MYLAPFIQHKERIGFELCYEGWACNLERKQREERYDREEEVAEQPVEDEAIAKKAMTERTSDGEEEEEKEEVNELEGIPIDPSDLKVANKPKAIFILERASLEVAKVGKVFNL